MFSQLSNLPNNFLVLGVQLGHLARLLQEYFHAQTIDRTLLRRLYDTCYPFVHSGDGEMCHAEYLLVMFLCMFLVLIEGVMLYQWLV